jgi:hypothetical protein
LDIDIKIIKHFIVIVCIFIALFLIAVPLTGCEAEVSFTTASLSEARMSTGVDNDLRPVGLTDVFHKDTPEIFCTFKISNAPSDTEVKAVWIYIEGELKDLKDHVIGEWSTEAGNSRYIYASLTRPNNGWPLGSYKVVMYVDDKEELSVPFTVK